MPGLVVHGHRDAYEAVARLPPIPPVSIAPHCLVDITLHLAEGRLACVLKLSLCPPLIRRRAVPAEGTEDLLVPDLILPVILVDFKLKQA